MTTASHAYSLDHILEIYARPFNDLIFAAQQVHRQHFDPNTIQCSTLLSIKTGAVRKTAVIAHKVCIIPAT